MLIVICYSLSALIEKNAQLGVIRYWKKIIVSLYHSLICEI
ncbi:hypothetical protein D1AOALGA4SA_12087 [Olavius algarvensis Delta 1 endosymbiont]|nr:hypothetical protein D1AOALGA4SA_12087 [Olavius algarvensis Delta 1 endosymbiont]